MTQPSSTTSSKAPADTPVETSEETEDHVKQQMHKDADAEASDVALGTVDELAELSTNVDELQQEVKDLQEQVLRRAAEFQNYRRRTETELGQAAARGREDVVLALLDVFDDMRRSIGAADQAAKSEETGPAFEALNDGVQLVFKKFTDVLVSFGVEPLECVGQPFDENLHEAMMQQPAPDPETSSGTVLAEIQPGYRRGNRILRHAKVVVAE